MKKLISDFTHQLKQAVDIAEQYILTSYPEEIKNIVISGMGGSGIGGNIVAEAIAAELKIPIIVNKDYTLPVYAGKNTLVIISSYSGDTEETVKAMEEGISKQLKMVCITSGGKIEKRAIEKKIDLILIPKGMPPRAAIAYSVVQLLLILNFHSVISDAYKSDLLAAIKLLDEEEKNMLRDAKEAAALISGKLPIIYSPANMESVALRFRQQLNENAKMLCWHNVFPELNHNELQGWRQSDEDVAVVIFRNETDYTRTAKRIDISNKIISYYDCSMKEVYSKGDSKLERMLYLIHWGDWVSYFIAEMNGIDTLDIRVITYLKTELAKVAEY